MGQPVAARRYDIQVKTGSISGWYATQGERWLALDAPAKGGRRIRYEPLQVPAAGFNADKTTVEVTREG